MTTTELIGRTDAPDGAVPGPAHPAHDAGLAELDPLLGVVPGEGPVIALLAGPLVLFGLALTGPFLLLLTLAALLVACIALVALAGAIAASPFLLARRLGRHRLPRAHRSAPTAHLVPVDSAR